MREFFLNLLKNLDKLCGLKQLDKIYAAHGEDEEGAKTEIKLLLDVLCRVSGQFPFIPESDQQKIIMQAVITEEFPSLNAHVVYTWLAKQKDKYFRESHHQSADHKTREEYHAVTGEARQEWLKKWEASLAGTGQMMIAKATDQELNSAARQSEGTLDWLRNRPKQVAQYRPPSEEDLAASALHHQYIRENYDPYTGKPKPEWMPEEEWIKKQNTKPAS